MSLQFVLGNSGSGKSVYMYHQLVKEAGANPTKTYLVVVPEQFTMQTQRELVDLAPNKAIMNIDVVSFPRLAYRVFDELGRKNLTVLEETGKNLVLRKVAQQKEEELTILRPNLNRMGYISELKSLLSEMMQYNITPECLKAFVESGRGSQVFSAKLTDVITMYQGFEQYIKDSYITAEEILTVLSDVADQSKIIRDSVIVFDEFTGFTPVQMKLMQRLLVLADSVWVALTIDAREDFYRSRGVQELFHMPKKTIQALQKMCEQLNVEVREPVILSDGAKWRFAKAPSLYFMEQNLFRPSYQRKFGEIPEIGISAVKNPREEMLLVARRICHLVREEGYRYKDIAVVTGDMDTYGNYVEHVFAKYQIPCFLDRTREILFHPFIEFIRAALEVVSSDFSYQAVFRYLRCGFCGIREADIDRLENYVLATGIRGKSVWSRKFLRMPRNKQNTDLERMEELRGQIYGAVAPIYQVFHKKDSTVGEQLTALYHLIEELGIEAQLGEREQQYLESGMQTKAKEYGQIYRIVMDLFDKIYSLLGEDHMEIQEFVEVLDAGLDAAKVAVIPPGYDSVTIGDIERTRLNHVRALFFIGVNDGIIPKAGAQGGIISEYERQILSENDMELAPGPREQVFIQKFYLYLNLTKPSEKLYLSYACVDRDGKSLRPSYLIGTVLRMFPDMKVQMEEELTTVLDHVTPEAALDYLIRGERGEHWYALAKWFLKDDSEKGKEAFEQILTAEFAHYEDEPISRAIARAIYGRTLEGSVTRLERFAACAYAHFLQYGLRLRERDICGFAEMDMGNIYHEALQIYSVHLKESEYDWFTVPEEIRDDMAKEAFEQAVAEYSVPEAYEAAESRHQLERMQHILQQTVWALTKQVRKGRFVPSEFEISFSREEDLEAIQFQLDKEEQMKLTGRIDRLDICQEDGRLFVKVIDYKSGNTKFDLVKIYQGMQLQLVVYMNAAIELERKAHPQLEMVPGAIFYYHIDDPVIEMQEQSNLSEEEYKQVILKALCPDGLVNRDEDVYRAMDDEFEEKSDVIPVQLTKKGTIHERNSKVAETMEFDLIQKFVRSRIETCGREIYQGKISVNPYTSGMESSCNYCPYQGVCGLDPKIPGYRVRTLENLKKDEVFDRMQTELAVQESRKE